MRMHALHTNVCVVFGNSNSQVCPVFHSGNPLQDLSNSARHKTAFTASVGSQHTLLKHLPVPVPLSLGSCGTIRGPMSATQVEGSGGSSFHRVRTCGEWLGSCSVGSGDTALKEKAPGPQSATYPLQNPGLLGFHQRIIAF